MSIFLFYLAAGSLNIVLLQAVVGTGKVLNFFGFATIICFSFVDLLVYFFSLDFHLLLMDGLLITALKVMEVAPKSKSPHSKDKDMSRDFVQTASVPVTGASAASCKGLLL